MITVGCISWYLWRNLMGCDFLKVCLWLHCVFSYMSHTLWHPCYARYHIQIEGFTIKEDEKALLVFIFGLSPGACHLAVPQGGLLVTLAIFDLLLPLQNWGMHSTETHDISTMGISVELRNHCVLCVAIQAFSARTSSFKLVPLEPCSCLNRSWVRNYKELRN